MSELFAGAKARAKNLHKEISPSGKVNLGKALGRTAAPPSAPKKKKLSTYNKRTRKPRSSRGYVPKIAPDNTAAIKKVASLSARIQGMGKRFGVGTFMSGVSKQISGMRGPKRKPQTEREGLGLSRGKTKAPAQFKGTKPYRAPRTSSPKAK